MCSLQSDIVAFSYFYILRVLLLQQHSYRMSQRGQQQLKKMYQIQLYKDYLQHLDNRDEHANQSR